MRWAAARTAVWAILALAVAGCSADEEDAARPAAASPTATPTSAAPLPSPSPLSEDAVPVVQLADRPHARVELAGGPDWLAVAEDRVFVKLDRGEIVELDRVTAAEARVLPGADDLCQGLGAGFGALWTCGDPGVRRIDLATGEQSATVALRKAFEQGHLATGFDRVWVLTGTGEELVGIDPSTNQPATTVALEARGHDVAVGPDGVWVVSGVDDQVLRIDPATGSVTLRVTGIGDPRAVAVGADVWVAAPAGVYRLDRTDGAVRDAVGLPAGGEAAIAADDDEVWLRTAAGFLHRIDARDPAVVERVAADLAAGGDVALTPDAVWATAHDDGVVVRLARP